MRGLFIILVLLPMVSAAEHEWELGEPGTDCFEQFSAGAYDNQPGCKKLVDDYVNCMNPCLKQGYEETGNCLLGCRDTCMPKDPEVEMELLFCFYYNPVDTTGALPEELARKPLNIRMDCYEFGVLPSDVDLAYTQDQLRKEFMDVLKNYKGKLTSSSDKYKGWDPSSFGALGLHMFSTSENRLQTGGFATEAARNSLYAAIKNQYDQTGQALTPGEVFKISLDLNNGAVFDSMLSAHNFFKQNTIDYRWSKTSNGKKYYKAAADLKKSYTDLLQKQGIMDSEGKLIQEKVQAADDSWKQSIKKYNDQVNDLKRQEELQNTWKFTKQLRENDNPGAWYHLFGTLTTGYAERENTWRWFGNSAYTRFEIFLEHRAYKGIWEWLFHKKKFMDIDLNEYCWDVWGGYLGGEIYNELEQNRKSVLERAEKHNVFQLKDAKPKLVSAGITGKKVWE